MFKPLQNILSQTGLQSGPTQQSIGLPMTAAIKSAVACMLLAIIAGPAHAEAPEANVGTFNSNVEYGVIFNGGMAIGGDAALELSVGTVHGDSTVDQFTANVTQGDGLSVALGGASANVSGVIFNGGLVIGGDMCAKTAIASVGASTCTYGTDSFSAESETN